MAMNNSAPESKNAPAIEAMLERFRAMDQKFPADNEWMNQFKTTIISDANACEKELLGQIDKYWEVVVISKFLDLYKERADQMDAIIDKALAYYNDYQAESLERNNAYQAESLERNNAYQARNNAYQAEYKNTVEALSVIEDQYTKDITAMTGQDNIDARTRQYESDVASLLNGFETKLDGIADDITQPKLDVVV
jgi:hypothetical protein